MTNYTDLINKYLSGHFTELQSEQFRILLQDDGQLREQYTILSKSREYLKAKANLEAIEKAPDQPVAEDFVKDYYLKKGKLRGIFHVLKRLGIVIIPLSVIIAFIIFVKSILLTSPNERLFHRYYQPLNRENLELEYADSRGNAHLKAGCERYLKKDYQASLKLFSYEPGSSFFQGISFIGLKEYDQALQQFEFYLEQNPDHHGTQWYMALLLLKQGSYNQAYAQLDRISKTENPYASSAYKLMSRIRKYCR